MTYSRDPVSVLMDAGARRLLARAYARPGKWAGTLLVNPSPRHVAWAARRGINLAGADPVSGGLAQTRWARGFTRALYYQHKWYSGPDGWRAERRRTYRTSGALVVEVGARKPGGRAVRVMLMEGGQAKARAVTQLDRGRRWADGGPARADVAEREWAG